MALSISGGNGSIASQANTQTPQNSTGLNTNASPADNVQPGTANGLLNAKPGSGGIALTAQTLPTVTINGTTTSTSDNTNTSPTKHHIHGGLLVVAVLLFIVAVAMFCATFKSEKNTTK